MVQCNIDCSASGGIVHAYSLFLILQVLCLNHNHVESLVGKPKNAAVQTKSRLPQGATVSDRVSGNQSLEASSNEAATPLMENLEVLHLAYNGIKDLVALQLTRLPSLKALFLQGPSSLRNCLRC